MDKPAVTNREILQQVSGGFEAKIGFWYPCFLGSKHSAIIASNHKEPSLHAYMTSPPTKLMCSIRSGNIFNALLNLSI